MPQLIDALGDLDVAEQSEHASLRVFGVRWRTAAQGPAYVTLDEALTANKLEVTELGEHGSVPQLKVVNRGDSRVFMMAGEELIGAKQNRVLNVSLMVDATSEQPIPVSCVEAGRWSYRSRRFTSAGTTSPRHLRKLMSKQMHESYKTSASATSDQGAVWAAIRGKMQRMGSASPSAELHQVYRDYGKKLDSVLQSIAAPEGCSGAVFASGDRILGMDLFDRPGTLQKLWGKITRGYAIDALEEEEAPAKVTSEQVRAWLQSLSSTKVEMFKSPGVGDDVRLQGSKAHGGALVIDEQPVHVEVFAEAPA
jgi:hypothetical protein